MPTNSLGSGPPLEKCTPVSNYTFPREVTSAWTPGTQSPPVSKTLSSKDSWIASKRHENWGYFTAFLNYKFSEVFQLRLVGPVSFNCAESVTCDCEERHRCGFHRLLETLSSQKARNRHKITQCQNDRNTAIAVDRQ